MNAYQQTFKRTEKKYRLDQNQYEQLLGRIGDRLEEDAFSNSNILNIYYDTPDHRLIRNSLAKPIYKEKLRLRSYGVPGDGSMVFVELKKKYKSTVYKRRIEMPYQAAIRYLSTGAYLKGHDASDPDKAASERQIRKEIDWFMDFYPGIAEAMILSYDRYAVNWIDDDNTRIAPVRITFDTNIRSRDDHLDLKYGSAGNLLMSPGERLMEIKLPGGMPVDLAKTLSELEIFPTSFSKYGKAYQERSMEKWQAHYSVQ